MNIVSLIILLFEKIIFDAFLLVTTKEVEIILCNQHR